MKTHSERRARQATTPSTKLHRSQTLELFDTQHRLILNLGGYGSGKTMGDALIFLDRSGWDTGQRGGFFANTDTQALEGIFPIIEGWLEKAGVSWVFGQRAPAAWIRRWERDGVPYPKSGPRSRNTLILDTGLHVIFGGLANGKFRRFKSYEFGWIIVEEITEQPNAKTLEFLIPRVRCGDGAACGLGHRHQIYVKGNPPPPDQPHWIREWVRNMVELEEERDTPFFRYIQSSTRENVANLGSEYIDLLTASLDEDTARAMIDGDLSMVRRACAASTFSDRNMIPVAYDPTRPTFVSIDFNVDPATALLAQELEPCEYPEGNIGTGPVLGVFGELYHEGGMDAEDVALALVTGIEKGLHVPENFKGLIAQRNRTFAYGDATGGMRRVESRGLRSAWKIVHSVMSENLGRLYFPRVPAANPSVHDSVDTLKAMLRAANGDIRVYIDPRCKMLRRDLESVRWKDDGTDIERGRRSRTGDVDKSDWRLTHLFDELRYLVHSRYSQHFKLKQGHVGGGANERRKGTIPGPYATQ